ncbi:MAG: M1 family metallopeptidase [Flavobacteriaceae bacterium]
MKRIVYGFLILLIPAFSLSQSGEFTKQDTLRGSITPQRAWWDLTYYHLEVDVDPEQKYISGKNAIHYRVIDSMDRLQIDLQPPLLIDQITQDGEILEYESIGNAHFISLKKTQRIGELEQVLVHYSGNPREASFPPWDGGFSWKTDNRGNAFVATSCQGIGASIWWPNKDHLYDEPDSMRISIGVPKKLMGVGNGRLERVEEKGEKNVYHWVVRNPINNYGVNVNIGDYVNFNEQYKGEKGRLDLDYYVLRDNLNKAKDQFLQVPMMLEAFEYWFGPYPFYEDSFKLVEVPYLGMEHQSSITYGNQYQNGYLGRDLSGSGWGMEFDFIIIHEAGHEWFANNITYKDAADMWVHEGFTAYSENLYLDYHYGNKAAADYVIGTRMNIKNDSPVIGPYGVNKRGSSDMYYKGSNLLHTLRQLIEDDALWREILRGLNEEFYHQTVTSKQIEDYISNQSGKDLTAFFNQYLRTSNIPVLEYRTKDNTLYFRYTEIVEGFDMPVQILINDEPQWVFPKAEWTELSLELNTSKVELDRNFFVDFQKIED